MAFRHWTRDESLAAFNVYCRLPFGRLHARNSEIQRVAALIDRTPDSLAMRCTNFASLDPALIARGIKGLSNVAQLDRDIWSEFERNPEAIAFASAEALAKFAGRDVEEVVASPDDMDTTAADEFKRWENTAGLDRQALVRVRVNQRLFRSMILASYESACAVCDLSIPALLVASHIDPWATDETLRMNPHNGICLCALHDRAFDTGIMRIEATCSVSIRLPGTSRESPAVKRFLLDFHQKQVRLPPRWPPDPLLLGRREDSWS